jgi:hypothetical protein
MGPFGLCAAFIVDSWLARRVSRLGENVELLAHDVRLVAWAEVDLHAGDAEAGELGGFRPGLRARVSEGVATLVGGQKDCRQERIPLRDPSPRLRLGFAPTQPGVLGFSDPGRAGLGCCSPANTGETLNP